MAVTPGWKFRDVLSAKDLNPKTVKFLRYMIFPRNNQTGCISKAKNHHIWGLAIFEHNALGEEPRIGRYAAF